MESTAGFGLLLKMLSDSMEHRINQALQSHNLTFGQHKMMVVLSHAPGHQATLKELEGRFHLAQSTVAGLAARMEKKGLVESYLSPDDRRVKYVRLTEAGIALDDKCRADFCAAEEQILAPLDEASRRELIRLLRCMNDHLRNPYPHPEGKD